MLQHMCCARIRLLSKFCLTFGSLQNLGANLISSANSVSSFLFLLSLLSRDSCRLFL